MNRWALVLCFMVGSGLVSCKKKVTSAAVVPATVKFLNGATAAGTRSQFNELNLMSDLGERSLDSRVVPADGQWSLTPNVLTLNVTAINFIPSSTSGSSNGDNAVTCSISFKDNVEEAASLQ